MRKGGAAPASALPKRRIRSGGLISEIRTKPVLFLMLLPMVALAVVFAYIPMSGILIAFENFNYRGGIFGSPFVGFSNFEFLFKGNDMLAITLNTFGYNLAFIVVNQFLEILFAIVLSELLGKTFKKLVQSSMFLPYFISWVIAGSIVYNLFNYEYGIVNNSMVSLGLERVDLMNNAWFWRIMLVVFSAWKNVGYGCIIYLSTITGIDTEMYDAAVVDGANILQRIWYVTLPFIVPTLIMLLLMTIGSMFRGDFGLFWQLVGNNPLVRSETEIIDTYIYRAMSSTSNFGMTTAAGIYQSVMGFVLIMTVNAIVKKVNREYALF